MSSFRFILLLIGCLLFCMPSHAGLLLGGEAYDADTLQSFAAGPGTHYTRLQLRRSSDAGGRLDVYLLHVDRRNPYVSIHTVLGNDSLERGECPSLMAQRKTTPTTVYFAGTNGDWWSTTRPGVPSGAFVTENTIATTPGGGRAPLAMAAIDQNDSIYFGHDFFTDVYLITQDNDSTRCSHVNDIRYANGLVLYNQYNGKYTHTDNSGTEVLCRIVDNAAWGTNTELPLLVEQVLPDKGNTAIPEGYVVLSGHGTMQTYLNGLQVGQSLLLGINTSINGIKADYKCALGGQDRPFMLVDGVVYNTWNENHPRTGLGQSVTGDTIIHCVVDGRGSSVGCTTGVLAEIMKAAGAWNAMNMEGGGSSSMNILPFGVMNVPSDGKERADSQGIFAVAHLPAEDNTVAVIRSYTPTLRLPKYGVCQPEFLSYNQYDVLLETDVEGVTLSCDEATGYIDDKGRFVCMGNGTLTATYGNITCAIPVRLEENALAHIRLDTIIVSDDTRYPIEVESVVGKNTVTIQPSALRWDVTDESVCTVSSEGVLSGLSNGGTWVYGTLGENKPDSLYVIVEIPATKPLLWNDMCDANAWKVEPSEEDWNTALRTNADGKAELYMHYTGGRQANIMLTLNDSLYSVPERVEFRCGKSDFPVKELSLTLQANKSREPKTHNVVLSPDWTSVSVRIDSLLGAEGDMSVYPVLFQDIILYLQTSSEYMNKDYVLPIEGIYLHYPKLSVGIESVPVGSLYVYPNPTADMLHISGISGCATAVLYDLQGRQVLAGELTEADSSLDISRLTEGTYLLQLQGQTVKIIKK